MQQLVRMHLAQAAADIGKYLADEGLADPAAFGVAAGDVLLQRVARFVGHHHVDGLVGAEKIEHPHDVGVGDQGQRPPLLEKALQTDAKHRQIGLGNHGNELARLAQSQGAGQVFLDGDSVAFIVIRQVNNTEPAGRNFLYNAISSNFQAVGQRGVVLCSH